MIGQGGDNMKRLMNASIVYGVLGLIDGVFYREFTDNNNNSDEKLYECRNIG